MSAKTHDELEARLTELFDGQARTMQVTSREWSDVPIATVSGLERQRKRRRTRTAFGAAGTIAAVAALIVGVMNIGGSDQRVEVKPGVGNQPSASAPVTWQSEQGLVTFKADDFVINANGKQFSPEGVPVEVHSDPGGAAYWTQEMTWQEHGVEMRLNIYFASDGSDWWATEIRTYNGQAEGDWITYTGTFFKTPLGQPFVGALDLTDPETGSSLHVKGMRLEVQPTKFDCTVGTGTFAVASSFERPAIELSPGSSEAGTEVWLLDRTSCSDAPGQDGDTFTWSSADPSIATVEPYPSCDGYGGDHPRACERGAMPSYRAKKAGQTTFHVVAKDGTTGSVVGERDFAVTVK